MNIQSLEKDPCQATRRPQSSKEWYEELRTTAKIALQNAIVTALKRADERRENKEKNPAA